ncbi:MAG: hypothetical protein F6J93_13305 [Oscillatoria sp. SIO1A7]|nr:hypothetical protein [Oscillatoria sp. SIO1A7]
MKKAGDTVKKVMNKTKKYVAACEVSDLPHETQDELYEKLRQQGYMWNSRTKRWDKRTNPDEEIAPIVDRNQKVQTAERLIFSEGFEGVRQRAGSPLQEVRIVAISDALNYGDEGLNLAISALDDEDPQVKLAAWRLLHHRQEPEVQEALVEHILTRYKILQNLLAAGNWHQADEETREILLKIVARQGRWLQKKDISKLPAEDLRIIDWLWVKYSRGKFGFSVQGQIWQQCLSEKRGQLCKEMYQNFCDRLGWLLWEDSDDRDTRYNMGRSDAIAMDLRANEGNLPNICALGGGEKNWEAYANEAEFSKMDFYFLDNYQKRWTDESFFGPEMIECFFNHLKICQIW